MIATDELTSRFAVYLGQEVEAAQTDGRITLLTPAEYPDCDAVAVYIEIESNGGYVVSDLATADGLLIGYLNQKSTDNRAEEISTRYGVEFEHGRVTARVPTDDGLPDACWRVARASAAIAEAVTFVPSQPSPRSTFDEVVIDSLRRREVRYRRNHAVLGLSGHEHTASVFIPATEAVIEPITGRKAWERATKVYAEFGDLGQVNGYKLVAVLDDRAADLSQEAKLLSQVGQVASWSRHGEWIDAVASR